MAKSVTVPHDPPVPATTTAQEDITTAGQRRINLIWEWTQAIIAVVVVVTTMGCYLYAMVVKVEVPLGVGIAFGMITGFYFSRTNHAAIGGIGSKPSQQYQGR